MNLRYGLIVASGFLILFAVYYFLPNAKPKPDTRTDANERLLDRVNQHPGLERANLSKVESESPCHSVIEKIETLPMTAIYYDLREGKLSLDSQCLFLDTPPLAVFSDLPTICKPTPEGELSNECMLKLMYYKGLRINRATTNQPLGQLGNEVLIHKYLGQLIDGSLDSRDGLERIRELGLEIYRRLPHSVSAAKMATVGFAADSQLSDENKMRFGELVDQLRNQFNENWDIFEIALFREKLESNERYANAADALARDFPESGLGFYHTGCALWSNGGRSAAQEQFQKALDRDANNVRFQNTLNESKKTPAPESVCTLQINFDPGNF